MTNNMKIVEIMNIDGPQPCVVYKNAKADDKASVTTDVRDNLGPVALYQNGDIKYCNNAVIKITHNPATLGVRVDYRPVGEELAKSTNYKHIVYIFLEKK